jgi:hypothetical protein
MVGEHMFARITIIVALAVLAWSLSAHSSQAHGAKQVITVRPHDSLWSIAQHRYGGDLRDAIWRIERANHLAGADVRVGQQLVLP